ncbi:hypothetical protein [Streptomyces sp. SDr-06]|uniref:hypothetical protein n=1 Tax=Streptomyces sp. SDr-06 TaxID=2267702 RepID=UPI003982E511
MERHAHPVHRLGRNAVRGHLDDGDPSDDGDQRQRPGHAPAEQADVLKRRQAFLEASSSFFYREGEPVSAEQAPDVFREGMLRIARATTAEERKWLTDALARLGVP